MYSFGFSALLKDGYPFNSNWNTWKNANQFFDHRLTIGSNRYMGIDEKTGDITKQYKNIFGKADPVSRNLNLKHKTYRVLKGKLINSHIRV